MKHLILILVATIAGCASFTAFTEGLDIRIETSPDKLFPGGEIVLFSDVENTDDKTYKNILIDVFDKGQLSGDCKKAAGEMKPESIESLECKLNVPDDIVSSQNIWTKVAFDGNLLASLQTEIISQDEYDLRLKTGNFQRQAKTYTFSDKNIQLTVDFDEAPPIVPGTRHFAKLKINNIGNGLVQSIKSRAVKVDSDILSCPSTGEIFPTGREFPTIACEINVPPDINYLSQHLTNIDIEYSYDVRERISIPR